MKLMQEAMDTLVRNDFHLFEALARESRSDHAPLEALARLETFGMLLRGWGRTFVVTQAGERLLAENLVSD